MRRSAFPKEPRTQNVSLPKEEAVPSTNTAISTIDPSPSSSSFSLDRRLETIEFRNKQNSNAFDDDDHHSIHHIQSKPISLDIRRTISFQTPNHSVCSLSALRLSVHSIAKTAVHIPPFVLCSNLHSDSSEFAVFFTRDFSTSTSSTS